LGPLIYILRIKQLSPTIYTLAQGVMISIATFAGYLALEKSCRGMGPSILIWTFLPSTFYTSFNSLPDATADSFFWIYLLAALLKLNWVAGLAIALAALSREAYIILPAITISLWIYTKIPIHLKSTKDKQLQELAISSILPITAFIGWKIHVTNILGPIKHIGQVLGSPMSFINELFNAFETANTEQIIGLLSHASLIAFVMISSLYQLLIKTREENCIRDRKTTLLKVISIFGLATTTLYLFFGKTVLFHYTGYMKADSILIIVLVCLASLSSKSKKYSPIII
jgi:hypothetical protein